MIDHSEAGSIRGSSPLVCVDAVGRRLSIRPPTALDTLRLFKAAGPILSQNEAWLAIATLASCVEAIDDVPVPAPANEMQIESIVAKLGDSGLEAVGRSLDETASASLSEAHVGN